MCRNIKKLRNPVQPATDEEIRSAALQYVRKVSGFQVFPKGRQAVLDEAVTQIAAATQALLSSLK